MILLDNSGYHVWTSVARVSVGDQWESGIQICYHLGMVAHVVQRGEAETGLAKFGCTRACTSLRVTAYQSNCT
jgi:hypothetical protein